MNIVGTELPKSRQAEQVILGSMLLDPKHVIPALVERQVTDKFFYWRHHRVIFQTAMRMFEEGVDSDLVLVTEKLRKENKLQACEGSAYLNSLIGMVTTIASVGHYVDLVSDAYQNRRVIEACNEVREQAFQQKSPSEVLGLGQLRLNQIQDGLDIGDAVLSLGDNQASFDQYLKRLREGEAGIRTDIPEMDQLIHFLRLPSYNFFFGRMKSGKTTLALNIALNQALRNTPVFFVSLEMTTDELQERLVRMRGGFSKNSLKDEANIHRVSTVAQEINDLPLYRYESSDDLGSILAATQKAVTSYGCKLVCIENLDLISVGQDFAKDHERMAHISRRLKTFSMRMAREGYPFALILLGQANREARATRDGFPLKSHVAGTDQVGRDVDLMISLSDPELVQDDHPDQIGVRVAAQRHDVESYQPVWVNYNKMTYKVGGPKPVFS